MSRLASHFVALLVIALLAAAGCSSGGSAAPTQPPAAKATETPKSASGQASAAAPQPTPVPTSLPTSVPASKSSFPEKGRAITIIVPFAAGTGNDIWARLLAAYLEKELGTPVQVANKPGATTQVGLTELAKSKPDGYTLLLTSTITTVSVYLDPERQAAFSRKDFQPIAAPGVEPMVLSVKADSPYKSTKELLDAAKAGPGKIKVGDNGLGSPTHMAGMLTAKAGGATWAAVHFDGDATNATALLGGHTDAAVTSLPGILPHFKSGAVRVLGITDNEESKFLPGVKTLPAQGYNVVLLLSRGVIGPAGIPADIVQTLAQAIKRITENDEFRKKADEAGLVVRYLDTAQFSAHWDDLEKQAKPLLEEFKAEQAK